MHVHVRQWLLKSLYPSDWNRSISAETNAFHFPPELCLISYKMFLQFHVIYFHCCLQLQVSVDVIISWAEYISLGICSAQLFFSEMLSFSRFVQDEFGEIKMRNWFTICYSCLWLEFYFSLHIYIFHFYLVSFFFCRCTLWTRHHVVGRLWSVGKGVWKIES